MALARGDAFVCGNERQRDYWLGVLESLGRLDLSAFRLDPTLRGLIDVVPFGLPAEPPVAAGRRLKGALPGIAPDDRVLLWSGGVVNWTDPATIIRAVALTAAKRPDVKLVFLGFEEPPRVRAAKAAAALSDSMGLTGRTVFFLPWIPYEERERYLLDADLGVAAYLDVLEARLAFRARLLDYFWAGLPTITTRGDTLGDLVAERGLGRALPPDDVDGWCAAIEQLLADGDERAAIASRLSAVREEFAWPRVVAPLERLLRADEPIAPAGRVRSDDVRDAWLRVRLRAGR
jgi:glycosyltransferase involved in cell wall biosynthesis